MAIPMRADVHLHPRPQRRPAAVAPVLAVLIAALSVPAAAQRLQVGNGDSFEAVAGSASYDAVQIGNGAPGMALLRVAGAGTEIRAAGHDWFRLIVGHDSHGRLELLDGAVFDAGTNRAACVTAAAWCGTLVGFGAGSTAELRVDGAGSELRSPLGFIVGNAAPLSQAVATTRASVIVTDGGSLRTEQASIGAWGDWPGRSLGSVVLHGEGSRWLVTKNALTDERAWLEVGSGADADGALAIGAGAQVDVDGRGRSAGWNDGMLVGHRGVGRVDVSGAGALLQLQGRNPELLAGLDGGLGEIRIAAGGRIESWTAIVGLFGGSASVTVTGAGSRIDLVGHGTADWSPGSVGPMLNVGLGDGGRGEVEILDGALIRLQPDIEPTGRGAFVGVGEWGQGRLRVAGRGSALQIVGPGLPQLWVGANPGGVGRLDVVAGARVQTSEFIVGFWTGRGEALVEGARIDATRTLIGMPGFLPGQDQTPGSHGELTLLGGALLVSDYVGVAASPTEGTDLPATGRLRVDASTVQATRIAIGAGGVVTGHDATFVGQVVNHGLFAPGNSPGTVFIDGSFELAQGGVLELEIAPDGRDGFVTDRLVFLPGSGLAFGDGSVITLRFLAGADPLAFAASGRLRIDTFLRAQDAQGGEQGYSSRFASGASWGDWIGGVAFNASADGYVVTRLGFDSLGDGDIAAVPVPEPASWALMLAGAALLLWRQRRVG